MPLLADRVRETTLTTGTGTIALDGPVVGFQGFNAAFPNGSTVYYAIQLNTEWEIGIGTVGTGTLARTTVLQSSNGDALVPFSAGRKDVFVTYVADRAVTTSDASTLTNKMIDSITNLVGADHIHYKIKANAAIAKGQCLKAVGYNAGESAIEVVPVSSSSDIAVGIAYQALNNGEFGAAINTGLLTGIKTDYAGWAIGDVLYPDPSTGGLTKTQPASGLYQAVAYVMRVQANNGVLLCEFTEPQRVASSSNVANTLVLRDGSGDFSARTITLSGAVQFTGTPYPYIEAGGIYVDGGFSAYIRGSSRGGPGAAINFYTHPTSAGALRWQISADGHLLAGTDNSFDIGASGANRPRNVFVSGNLTVDTNTLVVDAANNRVGILNATPGSTLHIGSTLASGGLADSTFALNVSSASNTFFTVQDATVQCYFGAVGTFVTPEMRIGTYTNHPLRMIVNNSQQWSFLSGGSFVCTGTTPRIGIGNALPDYSLHIGTTAPPAALGQVMVTGTAANVGVSVTNGTVQGYFLTDSGGSVLFGSFSSHDLVVRTNNTNRWTIAASTGHLLAGTDNTYDIGASGASRPRNVFVAGNVTAGGNINISAGNVLHLAGAGGNTYVQESSGTLFLGAGGVGRVQVNASGNVGVGATPSAWDTTVFRTLQVGTGAGSASLSGRTDSANNAAFGVNLYYGSGAYRYVATGTASYYNQQNGIHSWLTAPSGTAGNAITFTQAMTLDASGNLGVGTVTPFTRFDSARARTTTLNSIASFNTMAASFTDTTPYAVGVGGGINLRAEISTGSYSTLASIWSHKESATIADYRGSLIFGTADNATGYPSERWRCTSSGHFLAGTDNTYDIGASGATRPRTVYVGTSVIAPKGDFSGVQDTLNATYTQNGESSLLNLRNAQNGTAAIAGLFIGNDATQSAGVVRVYSSGYTTSGIAIADSVLFSSNRPGGLSLGAIDSSGVIRFYSGGTNERVRVKSGGQVRFVPLAAAPTTNVEDGDVYYDSTLNKLRVRAGGAWVDLH